MRTTVLAVIAMVLAFLAPFVWERFMSEAPESAWRIVFLVFIWGSAAFVFLSDPVYRRLSDARNNPFASTAIVALLAAATLGGTWRAVFVPLLSEPVRQSELKILTTAKNADYPNGTTIGGIAWSRRFTDLRIVFLNSSTSDDYIDIDLLVRPDQPIAEIGQLSSIPNVHFSTEAMSTTTLDVQIVKPDGTRSVVPLVLIASDEGYRVHGPKIPRNSQLEIVVAIVAMAPAQPPRARPNNGVTDRDYWALTTQKQPSGREAHRWFGHGKDSKGRRIEEVFGARPTVNTVHIDGTYNIGQEQRTVSKELQVSDFIGDAIPDIRKAISKDTKQ